MSGSGIGLVPRDQSYNNLVVDDTLVVRRRLVAQNADIGVLNVNALYVAGVPITGEPTPIPTPSDNKGAITDIVLASANGTQTGVAVGTTQVAYQVPLMNLQSNFTAGGSYVASSSGSYTTSASATVTNTSGVAGTVQLVIRYSTVGVVATTAALAIGGLGTVALGPIQGTATATIGEVISVELVVGGGAVVDVDSGSFSVMKVVV